LLQRRILHRLAVTVLDHVGPDHRQARHVVADGQDWNSEVDRRLYEKAQVAHHRLRRLRGYVGHPETPPGELILPEDGGASTLLWEPLPAEEDEREVLRGPGRAVALRQTLYRVTVANVPTAVMRLVGEAAAHETMPLMALQGWTRIDDAFAAGLQGRPPWQSILLPALACPHWAWHPDGQGGESPHLRWIARSWDGPLQLPYGTVLSGAAGRILSDGRLCPAPPPSSTLAQSRRRA